MKTEMTHSPVLEYPYEAQHLINSLFNSIGSLKEVEEDLWVMFSSTLSDESDGEANARRAWLFRNLVFHLKELAKYKE